MNVLENRMRDGSVDFATGWLFDGNYYERYRDLSTGVGGLAGLGELGQVVAQLPKIGQEQVREALADPEVAPIVRQLLKSPNPDDALAAQAEADIAETKNPTGKIVVFKSLAAKLAPKVQAVENAVMNALPSKDTEEGAVARTILATSKNPEEELQQFFMDVAAEAAGVSPEEVDETSMWTGEDVGVSGLGMSKRWKKRLRTVLKVGAIAAAVVVVGPLAVKAVGAVGGAIVGGVRSLFGGGTAPAAAAPGGDAMAPMAFDQPPGVPVPGGDAMAPITPTTEAAPSAGVQIPWGKLADLGVKVVRYKRAQAQAKAQRRDADAAQQAQAAQQAHEEAVQTLVQQGVPPAQAEQYVAQAEQQAEQQVPQPPAEAPGAPPEAVAAPGAPPGAPRVMEAGFPVLPLLLVGGVILLAMGMKGGGGGKTSKRSGRRSTRRSRRNPRRYYRSYRRRRSA